MSIASELSTLINTKTAIKNAIVAQGVPVSDSDSFASYATKIGQISGGGGIDTVTSTSTITATTEIVP